MPCMTPSGYPRRAETAMALSLVLASSLAPSMSLGRAQVCQPISNLVSNKQLSPLLHLLYVHY